MTKVDGPYKIDDKNPKKPPKVFSRKNWIMTLRAIIKISNVNIENAWPV